MTHDSWREPPRRPADPADIAARYGDLLGPNAAGDDPELVRLVADLDAYYAAEAPAGLATALDAAIRRRGGWETDEEDDALVGSGLSRPVVSRIERRSAALEGGIAVRTRRISTLVGSIAAVLVVGLLAAVLIGAHGGGTSGTSETGAQHFARVGGIQIVLRVENCPSLGSNAFVDCDVQAEFARMLQAEQQRASVGLGVKDAIVQQSGDQQITIDLPGYMDLTAASALFGGDIFDVVDTGTSVVPVGTDISQRLCPAGDFCQSNAYLIVFTGDQIDLVGQRQHRRHDRSADRDLRLRRCGAPAIRDVHGAAHRQGADADAQRDRDRVRVDPERDHGERADHGLAERRRGTAPGERAEVGSAAVARDAALGDGGWAE